MSVQPFTHRSAWPATPPELRAAIDTALGGTHDRHADLLGGMSPGPAARVWLDDGRSVFDKAAAESVSQLSHRYIGWEAEILERLPATVGAPTLLARVRVGDWIAVATSWAAGDMAGPPWTDATVDAAALACRRVAAHTASGAFPRAIDRLRDYDGWSRLASGRGDPLSDWEAEHAVECARLTDGWRAWTAGTTLAHNDLRADYILVDPGGVATLVDWAHGCAAAAWLDTAMLAADVVGSGHADGTAHAVDLASRLLENEPPEAGRFVVAMTGMFRYNSTLPAVPGMPAHRSWQRRRAEALYPLVERVVTAATR